jgi:hypothetical protein
LSLFFFPQKILCIGRNHIFQVEIWEKFSGKRNTEILESNIAIYFWGVKYIYFFGPPFSLSLSLTTKQEERKQFLFFSTEILESNTAIHFWGFKKN